MTKIPYVSQEWWESLDVCMGASLIDSTHKVNLSRNEEGSAEPEHQKLLPEGAHLALELEVGKPLSRSVVSKVLISGGKGIGETNGSGAD